jgi:hypothetical protein
MDVGSAEAVGGMREHGHHLTPATQGAFGISPMRIVMQYLPQGIQSPATMAL